MPNFNRGRKDSAPDDLEIVSRVMDTVQRQISSYRMSLEKLRLLRVEIAQDRDLAERIRSSPDNMTKILVERGIPEPLAIGMAAEDFQNINFGGQLGWWTYDCCCTECCITEVCHCTLITSITSVGRGEAE